MVLTYQHLLLDLSEILLQVIIAEMDRMKLTEQIHIMIVAGME